MILRTQLTPIFDANDIDVVLQGHDHTYSRSKLLYSDGETHGTYEFQLDETGTDYDWDNAYNTQTARRSPSIPRKATPRARLCSRPSRRTTTATCWRMCRATRSPIPRASCT